MLGCSCIWLVVTLALFIDFLDDLGVTAVARQTKQASWVESMLATNTWICFWKADIMHYPVVFLTWLVWCFILLISYEITKLPLSNMSIMLLTGSGVGNGKAWGCDLSYKYVEINAEYTTWDLYRSCRRLSSLVWMMCVVFRCNHLSWGHISYCNDSFVLPRCCACVFFPMRSIKSMFCKCNNAMNNEVTL